EARRQALLVVQHAPVKPGGARDQQEQREPRPECEREPEHEDEVAEIHRVARVAVGAGCSFRASKLSPKRSASPCSANGGSGPNCCVSRKIRSRSCRPIWPPLGGSINSKVGFGRSKPPPHAACARFRARRGGPSAVVRRPGTASTTPSNMVRRRFGVSRRLR